MADDPFRPLSGSVVRHPGGSAPASGKGDWIVCVPVPKNAPPAPKAHPKRGKPSRIYVYRDASGALAGYVYRFDQPDGGKEFLPLTFCRSAREAGLAWRWQSWPAPRPLYGLDRLAKRPNAPVLLVEGEKACEAAAELFPDHVTVTSPHGSQSGAKADWSPLSHRDVTIWPDADEAGRKYAETVARLLAPLASSIKLLDPPENATNGWDAADALAQGWDRGRADAFLASAEEWGKTRRRGRSEGGGSSRGAPAGADDDAAEPHRRKRQADELLELAEGLELWHSPDRDPYATVPVKGHFENWAIRAKGFRLWLAEQFFRRTGRGASSQATEDALRTIEAMAITMGAEHTPCLRIGTHGNEVFLDLADAQWRAVRISEDGWVLVDRAPCKFLRTPAMAALPEPQPGGSVDELRSFIQLDDDEFMLSTSWLVDTLNPVGPYPVLAVYGPQGSGKTGFARRLRSMIDPSLAPDRAPPRDERGLCLAAKNAWVLALDNLSSITPWLSDAMCRISTGGGISDRVLYTNDEEVIYFLKRPQVFTAIPEAAVRSDLISRSISVTLPALPKFSRRTEAELEAQADKARPLILGALLDAAARALRCRAEVPPVQLPRMADFATWIWRACPALGWEPKIFLDAYERNQAAGADTAFEADGLGAAIVALLALRKSDEGGVRTWSGTSTTLLDDLPVDEAARKSKWWPVANQVRNRLRRLQEALGARGVILDLETRATGRGRDRLITITSHASPLSE